MLLSCSAACFEVALFAREACGAAVSCLVDDAMRDVEAATHTILFSTDVLPILCSQESRPRQESCQEGRPQEGRQEGCPQARQEGRQEDRQEVRQKVSTAPF